MLLNDKVAIVLQVCVVFASRTILGILLQPDRGLDERERDALLVGNDEFDDGLTVQRSRPRR